MITHLLSFISSAINSSFTFSLSRGEAEVTSTCCCWSINRSIDRLFDWVNRWYQTTDMHWTNFVFGSIDLAKVLLYVHTPLPYFHFSSASRTSSDQYYLDDDIIPTTRTTPWPPAKFAGQISFGTFTCLCSTFTFTFTSSVLLCCVSLPKSTLNSAIKLKVMCMLSAMIARSMLLFVCQLASLSFCWLQCSAHLLAIKSDWLQSVPIRSIISIHFLIVFLLLVVCIVL